MICRMPATAEGVMTRKRSILAATRPALGALLAVAALGAHAQMGRSCQQDREKVLTRAMTMSDAFKRHEVRPVVDMMYPPIIEAFGGREQYIALGETAMAQLVAEGLKVERLSLGEPTRTYRDGARSICFIPKEMVLSFFHGGAVSRGYLVAIHDPRVSPEWTFLDSDAFKRNPDLMRKLFPGLPADVQTPPVVNERVR
jgi:hypothetical protein